MERVTGIGGIFFKAQAPKKLQAWYQQQLGITPDADGYVSFHWREKDDPERAGFTAWSLFPRDTKHFDPSQAPFLLNYRVANLGRMLAQLRAQGVKVADRIEEHENGRFAWVMDPEGNRIELWEPK
jgi:predicted enzyme related to lactoylglutathione lyase